MSAGVAGTTSFRPNPSYTTLRDVTHWTRLEADRAFTVASRARRRAALLGRVRRPGRAICGLPVYDEAIQRRSGPRGVTEIPLEAIAGTTEPNRAAQFDQYFRPKA